MSKAICPKCQGPATALFTSVRCDCGCDRVGSVADFCTVTITLEDTRCIRKRMDSKESRDFWLSLSDTGVTCK